MTIVEQFDQRWLEDSRIPELSQFLDDSSEVSEAELRELILLDQYHRWQRGSPVEVEEYFSHYPQLTADREFRLALLLEEAGYMEECGRSSELRQFVERFPDEQEQLASALGLDQKPEQAAQNSDPASIDAGTEIGRYVVQSEIGRGAFGTVYLAYDSELNREVAVKVPFRSHLKRAGGVEEFVGEAQVLAALDHPNIVPVYDIGRFGNGDAYVVSKRINGQALESLELPVEPRRVAEIVAQVANGLHHAHANGIVHRDIKPANVLLDESGNAVVVDFGLSKAKEEFRDRKEWVGTPAYMSPEQARGESHRVNGQSDVFSLGIVMYELLTGRIPWNGSSSSSIMKEIQHFEVCPPRQLADHLDRELERICLRALANQSSSRYTTAKDMANDLENWLHSVPSEMSAARLSDRALAAQLPDFVPVMPRGLRSFGVEDSDFFLQLFPGPVNRDGVPDVIAFWISKLDAAHSVDAFPVGLVYGPSGCGKSSMLKAGVLPRLSARVLSIYHEALPGETESTLLMKLKNIFPELPQDVSLCDAFRILRTDERVRRGRKVVLVLDQFEQWLQHWSGNTDHPIVDAMRQCDGSNLQCLLSIRDDFWMAATRFMKLVDVPIANRVNSEGVELFNRRHASKVLVRFGQAFGALDGSPSNHTEDQLAFVNEAIELLVENEKVSPVRLAVFAEMVKDRDWSLATLERLGGATAIGTAFLDDCFGASGVPRYRLQTNTVRQVLAELMPESGSDIKGEAKSIEDLRTTIPQLKGAHELRETLNILDQEVRLITPTEEVEDREGGDVREPSFRLTHDFLVPSIREWLTREKKETMRGRAELLLAERTHEWNEKRENRKLPSLGEWIRIRLLTDSSRRSSEQIAMIGKTTARFVTLFAMLAVCGAIFGWAWYESNGKRQADALIRQLVSARPSEVPGVLSELEQYERWADPMLERIALGGGNELEERDRERALSFVHIAWENDAEASRVLSRRLFVAEPSEHRLIVDRLKKIPDYSTDELWEAVSLSKKSDFPRQLRAAIALAQLEPESENWDENGGHVAHVLTNSDPVGLGDWIEPLDSIAEQMKAELKRLFRNGTPVEQKNTAYLLARYASALPEEFADLILQSNEDQLSVLFPIARQQAIELWPLLESDMKTTVTLATRDGLTDEEYDRLYGRWANALVFNSVLAASQGPEGRDLFFQSLKSSENNTLRSFLIHRYSAAAKDAEFLFERLVREKDDSIRQAIVLALGAIPIGEFSESDFTQVTETFFKLFVNEQDSGVQSAVDLALRKWGFEAELRELRKNCPSKFDGKRNWFFTSEGHRMVVVHPRKFFRGTDESDIKRFAGEPPLTELAIERTFAIADRETSVKQFDRFLENHSIEIAREKVVHKKVDSPDSPVMNLSWYACAHYCNWLSEQEGIPKDQWCYEPNSDGEYGPGMKIVANHLELSGFQLPTRDHWQCAGRAGTVTSRSFGSGLEMLPRFVWTQNNSKAKAQPVATLKPNSLGMFDILGNANEWLGLPRKMEPDFDGEVVVESDIRFPTANGGFRVNERGLRMAGFRANYQPDRIDLATTVRPMRIIQRKP